MRQLIRTFRAVAASLARRRKAGTCRRGKWKRIVASRAFYRHDFPAPHIDAVECVVDYRVPVDKFSALAEFDGSVIVERTAGEVSARCHDEQANFLALNLMHDIVTGRKDGVRESQSAAAITA